MGMTGAAVRLPDQFRRGRDTPMAATPTCCCCCCCLSTLLTSSVVLPMRVELLARQASSVPPARISTSKLLAGMAPVGSLALATLGGIVFGNIAVFLVAWPLAMAGALAWAYAPFGHALGSLKVTAVFAVAFAFEFLVGLYGLILTAGIGYVLIAGFGGHRVLRAHKRRLAEGQAAPRVIEGRPPPPVPRPPSGGGAL